MNLTEAFGTQEQLRADLETMDLPPLLASAAQFLDDASLLKPEYRPTTPVVMATTPPDGCLDAATAAAARDEIADRLWEHQVPAETATIPLEELTEYLTGAGDPDMVGRLKREIASSTEDEASVLQEVASTPAVSNGSQGRVAIIGAGMSGIAAAIRLVLEGKDVVLFDENPDFGGTWLVNTYPGCRLDTSNFLYSYSFAPRSTWRDRFSTQGEILSYFQEIAGAAELRRRTRFSSEVTACHWTGEAWRVTWRSGGREQSEEFQYLVSAVGQLRVPKVPDFKGLEDFAGEVAHTGAWPEGLDLSGKKVAVIGSGASAFQLVPAIVDEVESLVVFQRSSPWMLPTPDYHDELPAGQRRLLDAIPSLTVWHRFWTFWVAVEGRYTATLIEPGWEREGSVSALNEELRRELTEHIVSRFPDRPDLAAAAVPDYPPGAKRLLRDNGVWPKALQDKKTVVDAGPVEYFDRDGVVSGSGERYDVDVVVTATGFDASHYLDSVEVTGIDGVNLQEKWDGEPRAYLGITVPDFPNLFMLVGPNTNLVVNGSLIFIVECALDYITQCMDIAEEAGAAFDTTDESYQRFIEEMDEANAKTAWAAEGLSNWYRNARGAITQTWPYPLMDYWSRTQAVDMADHRLHVLAQTAGRQ